jgi:predicted nucleic acid-binding protein
MTSAASDRRIFVDTSGYYAAASRRDSSYAEASATIERLVLARRRLVTTNFVLAELHGLLLARGSPVTALATLARIRQSPATTVVRVRQRDEDRAWSILTQYDDKEFSLTDALSFAVMERLGISVAFTFDQHFAQFGWRIVSLRAS